MVVAVVAEFVAEDGAEEAGGAGGCVAADGDFLGAEEVAVLERGRGRVSEGVLEGGGRGCVPGRRRLELIRGLRRSLHCTCFVGRPLIR